MRKIRKVAAILMTTILLLISAFPVSAADYRLGTVVGGSLLTDGTKAEGFVQPLTRGSYLSGGSGAVFIVGGRTLEVSGSTSCYRTVDSVKVTLYLQKLVGDNWEYVATIGPRTAFNNSYVAISRNYTVSGGYYYRVQGAHTAILNGVAETGISYSNGIWVY